MPIGAKTIMCVFRRDDNKQLSVDSISLGAIAKQYGSPVYVYSAAGITDAFTRFQNAVAPVNGKVYFAMKANSALGVLALIGKLGGGMDIVSAGELARAIAAGIKPSDVVFSGVGKTNDEIRQALACDIGQINAESQAEVTAISAIAREMNLLAPVALRVNVDVSPSTHAKISTGERNTKFGIATNQREAFDIYQKMARDPHISPAGLAVHIGSQIRDLVPFERAYSALLALAVELRNAGLPVPNLDLGGGVGVDYDTAGPTDFTEYGLLVQRLFAGQGFSLGFEPGRSIIANNGALITRVIYVKQSDEKRFIIVDAAMNDLLRPTLYEAHHAIWTLDEPGISTSKADIVGPVCETGDYLGLDRDMPNLSAGDGLAILSAGAYGAAMASNYNSRSPAAEVMVVNGTTHLLRAARPIADYINDEMIPNFANTTE
jgi:diaminopimelate decarboxylase